MDRSTKSYMRAPVERPFALPAKPLWQVTKALDSAILRGDSRGYERASPLRQSIPEVVGVCDFSCIVSPKMLWRIALRRLLRTRKN